MNAVTYTNRWKKWGRRAIVPNYTRSRIRRFVYRIQMEWWALYKLYLSLWLAYRWYNERTEFTNRTPNTSPAENRESNTRTQARTGAVSCETHFHRSRPPLFPRKFVSPQLEGRSTAVKNGTRIFRSMRHFETLGWTHKVRLVVISFF